MVRDSEWEQDGCCSGVWEEEAVEDFAVPRRDDWGTLVHLKLPRRKGLVPEVVGGLSTGPGEEVEVVG